MDNKNEEERIFFQDNNVLVSQSRLVIAEKTYVLRNISAVSTTSNHWFKKPNKSLYKVLIGVALMMMYAQYKNHLHSEKLHIDISTFTYFMMFVYITVIIYAIYKMFKLKIEHFYSYSVRINTNSGTSDVLSSPDKEYIQKVVGALNQAIIYRG